jgi:hypothetical protein
VRVARVPDDVILVDKFVDVIDVIPRSFDNTNTEGVEEGNTFGPAAHESGPLETVVLL